MDKKKCSTVKKTWKLLDTDPSQMSHMWNIMGISYDIIGIYMDVLSGSSTVDGSHSDYGKLKNQQPTTGPGRGTQ